MDIFEKKVIYYLAALIANQPVSYLRNSTPRNVLIYKCY